MLKTVTDNIKAYFVEQKAPGGLLEGVKTVRKGDVDPLTIPSAAMPCIIIHLDDVPVSVPRANHLQMKESELTVWLYVGNKTSIETAYDTLCDLLLSPDKSKGLLKAIALKRGYATGIGEDKAMLLPAGGPTLAAGQSDEGYVYGARMQLKLRLEAIVS